MREELYDSKKLEYPKYSQRQYKRYIYSRRHKYLQQRWQRQYYQNAIQPVPRIFPIVFYAIFIVFHYHFHHKNHCDKYIQIKKPRLIDPTFLCKIIAALAMINVSITLSLRNNSDIFCRIFYLK